MNKGMKTLAVVLPLLFLAPAANSQDVPECVRLEIECTTTTVPEPGTLLLLAGGLAGMALARKRRK